MVGRKTVEGEASEISSGKVDHGSPRQRSASASSSSRWRSWSAFPHVEIRTIFNDLLPTDDPFVQVYFDHPNFGNPLTDLGHGQAQGRRHLQRRDPAEGLAIDPRHRPRARHRPRPDHLDFDRKAALRRSDGRRRRHAAADGRQAPTRRKRWRDFRHRVNNVAQRATVPNLARRDRDADQCHLPRFRRLRRGVRLRAGPRRKGARPNHDVYSPGSRR